MNLEKDHQTTILDNTKLQSCPWDRLKLWKVFTNHSVFNTLKGHIYPDSRLPSPLSMLLWKSALSAADSTLRGGGEGGNRRGTIFREKVRVSQHFVQDCSITSPTIEFALQITLLHNGLEEWDSSLVQYYCIHISLEVLGIPGNSKTLVTCNLVVAVKI